VAAITDILNAMMGISKTCSLFPGEKKPSQVFKAKLSSQERGPCPLKPSNGFLNTHHSLLIYYHRILDADSYIKSILEISKSCYNL